MVTPRITIRVPAQTSSDAPDDIVVRMTADLPTYFANNGILDRALQVVMVRRDMPGIGLLAKTDPDILFVPEPPLNQTTDPGTMSEVSQDHRFGLLDFGAEHDGAANYFVFAAFAGAISAVYPMEVRHALHSVGAGDAHPVTAVAPALLADLPPAPAQRGVWARQSKAHPGRIEGILRTPFRMPLMRGDAAAPPYVTIAALRLDALGGVSAATFLLDPVTEGVDFVARFSLPLDQLAPPLAEAASCRLLVMVFSGDFQATPFEIDVTPAAGTGHV